MIQFLFQFLLVLGKALELLLPQYRDHLIILLNVYSVLLAFSFYSAISK